MSVTFKRSLEGEESRKGCLASANFEWLCACRTAQLIQWWLCSAGRGGFCILALVCAGLRVLKSGHHPRAWTTVLLLRYSNVGFVLLDASCKTHTNIVFHVPPDSGSAVVMRLFAIISHMNNECAALSKMIPDNCPHFPDCRLLRSSRGSCFALTYRLGFHELKEIGRPKWGNYAYLQQTSYWLHLLD